MRPLTVALTVLLTVSVAWAAPRAPMPSLESYDAHPVSTVECGITIILRVGYDTPETVDEPIYDVMAFYIMPDVEHPFLILFIDGPDSIRHFFLSRNHDGFIDKDGDEVALWKLAPNRTLCELLR